MLSHGWATADPHHALLSSWDINPAGLQWCQSLWVHPVPRGDRQPLVVGWEDTGRGHHGRHYWPPNQRQCFQLSQVCLPSLPGCPTFSFDCLQFSNLEVEWPRNTTISCCGALASIYVLTYFRNMRPHAWLSQKDHISFNLLARLGVILESPVVQACPSLFASPWLVVALYILLLLSQKLYSQLCGGKELSCHKRLFLWRFQHTFTGASNSI